MNADPFCPRHGRHSRPAIVEGLRCDCEIVVEVRGMTEADVEEALWRLMCTRYVARVLHARGIAEGAAWPHSFGNNGPSIVSSMVHAAADNFRQEHKAPQAFPAVDIDPTGRISLRWPAPAP